MRIRRRFGQLPGWLKILMIGQFVSAAGALAWLYLTLYLVADRGLDPQHAGLAAAIYGLGLLLGNLGGGWFGDRFGMRRGVLASLAGWAVLCLVMPFVSVELIPMVGGVAGACAGATRPLSSALVATALPTDRRREGIALSRTASNAGFVLGPPIGGLLVAYDFTIVFFVDALSSLVLAALVWTKVPASAGRAPHGRRVGGLWRELARRPSMIVLLAAVLVVDTVYRQLYTSLPLLMRDTGAPSVAYGLLIALNAGLIVLAEAPLAAALRYREALAVIPTGFALVALGFVAIAVWPVLAGAALAVVVITAGEMLYKPTATAFVVDAAPDRMAGRFSSLYAAASIGGMTLGPALGGAVYQHQPSLLWTFGALAAFLAAAAMWLSRTVGANRPVCRSSGDGAPASTRP